MPSTGTAPVAQKTIFLHIHKTAGMSLRGLCTKNYRHGRHFNTELRQITTADWLACRERVQNLTSEELASYQVFKGHMYFGLHENIPAPSRYFTFLREPIQRALSHYRMVLRKKELPEGHRIDPTLPDWNLGTHAHLSRSIDNGQTRVIAGVDPDMPFGACNETHLEAAKNNLDAHFDFIGLTEHFDLSILVMRRACGWGWHFYVPDNVAPQDHVSIPAHTEEDLRLLNRFDLELYDHAREKFHRMVKKQGLKLKMEHQAFRLGNSIHQRLHRWKQARKQRRGATTGSLRGPAASDRNRPD